MRERTDTAVFDTIEARPVELLIAEQPSLDPVEAFGLGRGRSKPLGRSVDIDTPMRAPSALAVQNAKERAADAWNVPVRDIVHGNVGLVAPDGRSTGVPLPKKLPDSFPLARALARSNSTIVQSEGERIAFLAVADRLRADLAEATADAWACSDGTLDPDDLVKQEGCSHSVLSLDTKGKKVRQLRSNRLVWTAVGSVDCWNAVGAFDRRRRYDTRRLTEGAPIPYDQLGAVSWEYGPETVTVTPQRHLTEVVQEGGIVRKVWRTVDWRVVSQRATARWSVGTSVWQRIYSEPSDPALAAKMQWRLVRQTIAHNVDNGGPVDHPVDERVDAASRVRIVERALGADLFRVFRSACMDGADVGDLGTGTDDKTRRASGATAVRIALRRAAEVYAEITRAEELGVPLEERAYSGPSTLDAALQLRGVFHAANDNQVAHADVG